MQEWVRKDVTDGIIWFCKQCKTYNPYVIVVFSKSQLSLQKWFLMLWFWEREYPVIGLKLKSNVIILHIKLLLYHKFEIIF